MDWLPDELLFHIFSFLDQSQLLSLASVSHRWMRICNDPLFWIEIHFSATFPRLEADTVLQHLATTIDSARVRSLDLSRLTNFDISRAASLRGLGVIMEHFYNVKELCLSFFQSRLTDPKRGLVWTVHSLTKLVLLYCSYISDEDARVIANCCTKLTHLDLYRCDSTLTDKGVTHFARCSRLEHLRLESCHRLTGDCIAPFGKTCTKLKRLRLIGFRDRTYFKALVNVISMNPDLRHLELSVTRYVTDAGVQMLANACSKLQELILTTCPEVSDRGVDYLTSTCKDLRCITLSGANLVTDAGVQLIAARCSHLYHLEISRSSIVTDTALKSVSRCLPYVKSLTFNSCNRITHQGVLVIIRQCRRMVQLQLQRCSSIGRDFDNTVEDRVLDFEHAANPKSSLMKLNLSSCTHLNDRCLLLMSCLSPSLRELDASECFLLTDSAVLGVSRHCPALVTLNMRWCILITDDTLDHLITNCKMIRKVFGDYCSKITDSAVARFRQHVPKCSVSVLGRDFHISTHSFGRSGFGQY